MRNFIQYSLKKHRFLRAQPTVIQDRELCPLQPDCYSNASKSQRTDDIVVKLWVCFFCLFCLRMKRDLWKIFFLDFWKKAMPLFKPFNMGISI